MTISLDGSAVKSWDKSYQKKFTFIDLFAGIGGFRIAAENNGGVCKFSSEWDKKSCETYLTNFGDMPLGDITKINSSEIPKHDVLFAGFPCQAFSISGKQNGFEDTRGTLFFEVSRILKDKRPKMFLLENVKNLVKHDSGRTFSTIKYTLDSLGYNVHCKILRSSDYGVPQARERIYIVGFDKNTQFDFPQPYKDSKIKTVKDILDPNGRKNSRIIDRTITYKEINKQNINLRKPCRIGIFSKGGQGERVYSINSAGITLSAYGGGMAGKTGAYKIDDIVRKLTVRECARMQGFPEDFSIPESPNRAYKQFGDSVSVPVVNLIVKNMMRFYYAIE